MASSRENGSESARYSMVWWIFSRFRITAILALVLLKNPTQVIANRQRATHDHDLYLPTLKITGLATDEKLLSATRNAVAQDDVESYAKIFGNIIPINLREPKNYIDYRLPKLAVEIKSDFFGIMCIRGNKKIAKFLLDNQLNDANVFLPAIAATAYQGNQELLEHLQLSKTQITEAFAWLSDLPYIPSEAKTIYANSLKLLIELGADINASTNYVFTLAYVTKDIDLISYYLMHGADMYKIVESKGNKLIPLEVYQGPFKFYAEVVNEFIKHGYDINFKHPQFNEKLLDTMRRVVDRKDIIEFLSLLKEFPFTKQLVEGNSNEIQESLTGYNHDKCSAKVNNYLYFYRVLSIILTLVTTAILIYKNFTNQKFTQEKMTPTKRELSNVRNIRLTVADVSIFKVEKFKKINESVLRQRFTANSSSIEHLMTHKTNRSNIG